jgi:GntP family gluconate:H+ symporter
MHPPFGFALFYLRSVAPTADYKDRVTGRLVQKMTTGQIYWGAIPFVLIQIVMVGLIIAFPGIVTHESTKAGKVDLERVERELERSSEPMPAAEPPAADDDGHAASSPDEDPTEAILRANEQDRRREPGK